MRLAFALAVLAFGMLVSFLFLVWLIYKGFP
jgi:hypothetical protein